MKRIFQINKAMKTLLLTAILAMASLYVAAQVGENDFTYNIGTGFNGTVNASATDANGKLVVGGAFTSYNGTTRNYIARLNTDGTLDTGFDPGTGLGAAVLSLAIQPSDGKIIVGGTFAAGVARLTTTGTVDGTFALTGTGLSGYVQTVALQSNEHVIIGGTFTTYNTSTTRNRIAILNTDGTLDTGFDPGTGLNGLPRRIAIQSDGKIIAVGGSSGFSSYNGTSRDNIVRIETTGAIDATFTPPANLFARLYDVKIQSDGKVVVIGEYNGNINSIFNGVSRFNTNGSSDNTFSPNIGSASFFQGGRTLAIQSDGKLILGGMFANGMKRLSTTGNNDGFIGSVAYGFEPESALEVNTIAIQSDGKIIAGGTGFTSFNGIGRNSITRIMTCSSVSITTQLTAATACVTGNTAFSVTASGTGLTYKWQVNTAALGKGIYTDVTNVGVYTGTTTNTLTITNATIGLNQYYYRCLVTDGTCTASSSFAPLTVTALPVVNTQPLPSTICENADATFTIAATNSGIYQWQEDKGSGFVNITSNGNGVSLTIPGATALYNGRKYRCVLGSCSPAVISSEVILTVNASPIIATQPVAPAIICTGGNAQFSVIATNASTYQWQEKVGAGAFATITNGGIYGGATTNTLSLTGATITQNSNQYRCIITGSTTCASTSTAVFFNVYAIPVISTHPTNSVKCVGSSTTFTVAVTSPPNGLTYQWQEKVGTGSFTNLTNGGVYSTVTAATLTLTAVTSTMNGNKYRCVVGTCLTPVNSLDADLVVDSPPVVTLQPVLSTICAGMTTSFTTNATGLGVTFQWQKSDAPNSSTYVNINNGGIYSGATAETLTLTNVTVGETGFRYRCLVTASGVCVAVYTSNVLLTVRTPPTFNTQPEDKAVCEGLTTSFSTSVIFSGTPDYQWQVSESGNAFIDVVANATLYPNGVNSSSLAVAPTFSLSGNKYRLRVSLCTPAVYSNEVTLTVKQTPAITIQPLDKTVCKGETVTFTVAATGSELTYQWIGASGTGMTAPTLTLTNVPASLNGSKIYCLVKGATGCAQVQSTELTLTVNDLVITTQPTAVNPFCPGGNASYSIAAQGLSLAYQWQEDSKSGVFKDIANGGIYSGSTTNKLDLTSVPFTMSGYRYRCVVKGSCGELNSIEVGLSVLATPAKPVIIISTGNPEAPVLTVANGDGFKWYKNGTLVSSSSSLTVTSEGSYTVIISASGCQSVVSDAVAIIITGDVDAKALSSINVYPNPGSDRVTLSLGGFEKDKPVSISIVDMQGRIMEKTSGLGQREISIDIRNYTSGKYIAWLQQRTTKVSRQFIKTDK